MFSNVPGSNFQTIMEELGVAVMLVLLILQTQANMLYILYKRILIMVNSNNLSVLSDLHWMNDLRQRFKWFEIERCRNQTKTFGSSESICVGLGKENVDK